MPLVKRLDFASELQLALDFLEEIESAGIVEPVDISGELYYSERQQLRIKVVAKGKRLGFSVKELKILIDAVSQPDLWSNGGHGPTNSN